MVKVILKDITRPGERSNLAVKEEVPEGRFPFYTLNQKQVRRIDEPFYFEPGIIMSNSGRLVLHYCGEEFAVSKQCHVIHLNREESARFNLKYIYYYLWFNFIASANWFPETRHKEYILNMMIPVLPLKTQNFIVMVLDRITRIIEQKEKNIGWTLLFQKSLFLDLFGDPMLDRENYEQMSYYDIILKSYKGYSHPSEGVPRTDSEQIAILKQSAITKQYFDPEQNKLYQPANRQQFIVRNEKIFVQKGDLLFCRKTTPELIGTSAYVFDECENLIFPDLVYRIEYNPEMVSGVYLQFLFNNVNFRRYYIKYITGTNQSMSNLPIGNLEQMTFPVPPLEKQKKFEQVITKLHTQLKTARVQLNELNQFREAVANRLFTEDINMDIEVELLSLLQTIMPNGDHSNTEPFENKAVLEKLIEKVMQKESSFESKELYDKAYKIILGLLKKEIVKQKFDPTDNKIKLYIA